MDIGREVLATLDRTRSRHPDADRADVVSADVWMPINDRGVQSAATCAAKAAPSVFFDGNRRTAT
jgi:hypothetical protein